MSSLYTEVAGTTCYLPHGERGTVTAFRTDKGRRVGAFVRSQETDAMFYIELGQQHGERGQHHEIAGARRITRDDFDRLLDMAAIRHAMGWRD